MPKDNSDVKNWISNYREQQRLPSSTCSIGTTVLSEPCCEDTAILEASLICWPSGKIACSSIVWSVFFLMSGFLEKQNVFFFILISSLLPFNWHQHWSSEYSSCSLIRLASGFSKFLSYTTCRLTKSLFHHMPFCYLA